MTSALRCPFFPHIPDHGVQVERGDRLLGADHRRGQLGRRRALLLRGEGGGRPGRRRRGSA